MIPGKTIILIPARMASTRLPGKPLADIAGKPMIAHVIDRALESGVGEVYVACCEKEVYEAVVAHGGKAVMTDPKHQSGTDRIYEVFTKLGKQQEYIVNVQGDLPTLDPRLIKTVLNVLHDNPKVDIATLACEIHTEEERLNPNIVKPVISLPQGKKTGQALYFSRACVPYGKGPVYHHIGLYAYRKEALARFKSLPHSALEQRESLEQLRALENGLRIDVTIVDTVPLGVDTPAELETARKILNKK
jgi:3-deoxy-manno-octulosonate cytidylyltransferase (CMP-KDO synthetase)